MSAFENFFHAQLNTDSLEDLGAIWYQHLGYRADQKLGIGLSFELGGYEPEGIGPVRPLAPSVVLKPRLGKQAL